eukprot:3681724-Pleurochrysis_carterae.AAC.2
MLQGKPLEVDVLARHIRERRKKPLAVQVVDGFKIESKFQNLSAIAAGAYLHNQRRQCCHHHLDLRVAFHPRRQDALAAAMQGKAYGSEANYPLQKSYRLQREWESMRNLID